MKTESLRFFPPGNPASPICEALINQDVYIGDDPVGHRCFREAIDAVIVWGVSYVVCAECREFVRETIDKINAGFAKEEKK